MRVKLGPEIPTLAERFIGFFRIPYVVACVVVGLGIFGVFDTALTRYVQTNAVFDSLAYALSPGQLPAYAMFAYIFYAPHFMRTRLLKSEGPLSQLLPGQEDNFHKLFGRVAAIKPQLVAWASFLALLVISINVVPPLIQSGTPQQSQTPTINVEGVAGQLLDFWEIAWLLVITLGFSSVVWTYFSLLRGIHKLGGEQLALRPPYVDSFLGLRPVGSLALSLAGAYFGFLGLILLLLWASPAPPTLGDIVGVGVLLCVLILLGLLTFFLPLRALHRVMLKRKMSERDMIAQELSRRAESSTTADSLQETNRLLTLEMLDRKISSMATWPFDFQVLGKFTIIVLSVTAALIARAIALALRI